MQMSIPTLDTTPLMSGPCSCRIRHLGSAEKRLHALALLVNRLGRRCGDWGVRPSGSPVIGGELIGVTRVTSTRLISNCVAVINWTLLLESQASITATLIESAPAVG